MKKIFRNQAGDTIVEVLLAITVLSVVLGITYSLASRAFRTLQISRDQIQATLILQEQAEGLIAMRDERGLAQLQSDLGAAGVNFAVVPQLVGAETVWTVVPRSSDPSAADNLHPNKPLYHVNNNFSATNFEADPTDPQNDMLTVTLTLTWDRLGGGTDSQTIVTRLRAI